MDEPLDKPMSAGADCCGFSDQVPAIEERKPVSVARFTNIISVVNMSGPIVVDPGRADMRNRKLVARIAYNMFQEPLTSFRSLSHRRGCRKGSGLALLRCPSEVSSHSLSTCGRVLGYFLMGHSCRSMLA